MRNRLRYLIERYLEAFGFLLSIKTTLPRQSPFVSTAIQNREKVILKRIKPLLYIRFPKVVWESFSWHIFTPLSRLFIDIVTFAPDAE